ncbi:MAG TPA: sialidase family protein [Chloroflexia bacterium]|nr:sialidase family protein [Chloroflexia bacterium]
MNNLQQQVRSRLAANKIGLGLVITILASLALGGFFGGNAVNAADASPAIGPDFQALWDRADKAVVEGKADRSWTWGPAISPVLNEVYREGGTRKVQYFDKARMELTQGRQVTNGLLAKEMITGLLQLGDNEFKQYDPNTTLNIAGDQGNQQNPTYVTFRKVATINSPAGENFASDNTGKVVTATLTRDGTTGSNPDLAKYNVKNVVFEKTLHHNIPDVFWKFETLTGPIYVNGQYTTGDLADWLISFGLPLTDAYWTRTIVKGQVQDVLVQAFERRVLTYTPSNDPKFQVEMGNVGQHYRDWRNSLPQDNASPTPAPTTPVATTPVAATPTPTPTPKPPSNPAPQPTEPPAPPSGPVDQPPAVQPPPGNVLPPSSNIPGAPNWASPARVGPQQLWRPAMAIRPTDGIAYIVGETGSGTPGVPAGALMLVRSDVMGQFAFNLNDAPNTANLNAHLTFDSQGTAYAVWRYRDPGYRAWFRVIPASGAIPHGWGLDGNFAGSGVMIDQPDIAYSKKTGKLYITGQMQFSPYPAWGFAESSDGGKTWGNYVTLATNRPAGDISPRISVDDNDNVFVAGLWGTNVAVKSRINGVWQTGITLMTNSAADGWGYRYAPVITTSSDGYAYVVWDSSRSFGIGRYVPGSGWQLVSKNAMSDNLNSRYLDITTTPDGRVWVSEGYPSDQASGGANIAISSDKGATFSLHQTAIAHDPDNEGALVKYSAVANRVYFMATFKNPRESLFTYTK